MPVRTSYGQGRFCWVDLLTCDPDRSISFYRELFGWEFRRMPASETSAVASLHGQEVAGLTWREDGGREGALSPVWRSYLSVTSAERTAEKVKMLSGIIAAPPHDVAGAGREAFFRDPSGALFGVWQPGERIGARLCGEPGTFCWHELKTGEPRPAAVFYQGLFGWSSRLSAAGDYTVFSFGGKDEAGMIATGSGGHHIPPRWLVYFLVGECERSAAAAEALGGTMVQSPMDIPAFGTSAIIQDPQGATLALFTPST